MSALPSLPSEESSKEGSGAQQASWPPSRRVPAPPPPRDHLGTPAQPDAPLSTAQPGASTIASFTCSSPNPGPGAAACLIGQPRVSWGNASAQPRCSGTLPPLPGQHKRSLSLPGGREPRHQHCQRMCQCSWNYSPPKQPHAPVWGTLSQSRSQRRGGAERCGRCSPCWHRAGVRRNLPAAVPKGSASRVPAPGGGRPHVLAAAPQTLPPAVKVPQRPMDACQPAAAHRTWGSPNSSANRRHKHPLSPPRRGFTSCPIPGSTKGCAERRRAALRGDSSSS